MKIISSESIALNKLITNIDILMHRYKIYGIRMIGIIEHLKEYIRTSQTKPNIPEEFYDLLDNCQKTYDFDNESMLGLLFALQDHLFNVLMYLIARNEQLKFEEEEDDESN